MMLVYLTGITFSHEPNTFEVQLTVDGTSHQSLVRVEVDERSLAVLSKWLRVMNICATYCASTRVWEVKFIKPCFIISMGKRQS
jgi:hypothetical protein